ncbi:MAG: 2-amino-4-hydroxy-6-hydroxymethyldihydropteridine diphosphokinase [Candidatus Muproteobacteria bacterium RBG_16_62_13]|uniref:2-amino-4-hydroxy-6-hydroxymethyldihydropteridine diphosphokinase n=1 Tax=Candidatus Muproteobacteria bacterium RBG_16_62_13 TaxID=1817756 RepID=A0A1F6T3P9_9PROT|nr:MAG: 2-amino-4-hydroxy-6-hydroxymethyldihydropteridine diphosphokinase [Candidatus Muproteobacteria bacterium RBG_16_62_13]
MPRVYISIGSNIDREQNIRAALHNLRNSYGHLIRSCVYDTPAVGFAGDPFYNLAVTFDTTDSIDQVVSELARIESAHGRRRAGLPKYSARTLDLDILLYGDLVRHDSGFDIPRGEILERDFVLGPLAEIAPDLKHPENGETFEALWKRYGRNHPGTVLEPARFED